MASGARRLDAGRLWRAARGAVRAIPVALRVIEGETVRLRAMALTYISLFALVPALVVAFSVVQAFTGLDRIGDRVHAFLFENLAVGAQSTIIPYLDRFVRNAHATSAGLVGGALLVWSAVTLFSNVEGALNDIWGIRRRRSLAQQAVIYWFGLTLGPLLLAGSVTLTAAARTFFVSAGVQALAAATGVLLTATFFSALYLVVPFTRVRLTAAVVGGFTAGLAWELAKWGYAVAVGRIFRYHAVYGSVAAVPIFLFWLFVSWTIVLFGARLAYVVQYRSTLLGRAYGASLASLEILAGEAMLFVARAFAEASDPRAPDAGEVASRMGASAEEAGEALTALRQAGLVVSLADGGLVPSRPLERITLLDVRRAVAGKETSAGSMPGQIAPIVRGVDDRAAEQLQAVTFRELCERARSSEAPVGSVRPSLEAVSAGGGGGAASTPTLSRR